MANYTTNFNLIKPEATDFYNVEDFNNNADIIDNALLLASQSGGGGFSELGDCTEGDLLTYLGNMLEGETGSFESRGCTNQPDGNDYWKITVLYNAGETAETHNMAIIAIGVNNTTYTNVMTNGVWKGWIKLLTSADQPTSSMVYVQSGQPEAPNNSLWAW